MAAMATSLDGSQIDIPGYQALLYAYTNSEILMKIGPLNSEKPGLEVDH